MIVHRMTALVTLVGTHNKLSVNHALRDGGEGEGEAGGKIRAISGKA